ncbi:DOMON domain-containing protein [Zavarzinella formosa]|uniref:hypothetical protein n=1 Tax=Zavarzinella formosa TaxID=360055 RepID=UPI00138AB277|nr:hypothetical protein [Zavarzinella formosa]
MKALIEKVKADPQAVIENPQPIVDEFNHDIKSVSGQSPSGRWATANQTPIMCGVVLVVLLLAALFIGLPQKPMDKVQPTDNKMSADLINPPLPHIPIVRHYDKKIDFLQFGLSHTMHVQPRKEYVKIDGDLKEWDRSKPVKSSLPVGSSVSEFIERSHAFEGYLMFDETYLYIGAHIADPFPLRNPQEPTKKGDIYKGGSVSLHISSKDNASDQVRETTPDNPLYRIEMWAWNNTNSIKSDRKVVPGLRITTQDDKVILLDIQATDNGKENTPAGAFGFDLDNCGYTMEYRVPWSVMEYRVLWSATEKMRMPAPEAKRALCWDIHWSDDTGTVFWAILSDVLNPETAARMIPDLNPKSADVKKPDMRELTYDFPKLWGQAVFHGK